MNILWITNSLLPEATAKLGGVGELKGSGSWILALAERIIDIPGISLTIATVDNQEGDLVRIKGEKINYYLIHGGRKGFYKINHSIEPYWRMVRDEVKPDVIHIHGTEYTHGLAWIEACGVERVCVSIQGLTSIIGRYYTLGLDNRDLWRSRLHYYLFNRGILYGKKTFLERGECEKEIIRRVNHVIGRTSWDKAHTWAINPTVTYHYCAELLRKEFYNSEAWSFSDCTPHSIFLSQGEYPLKGLIMVLRALPFVRKQYPDATLRVAGKNFIQSGGWREWLNNGDYCHVVSKLINQGKLEECITFTGPLNAQEMRREYLQANVFVCPSSIENSPNSLCEAQALGVPVLASFAGGIPDLMAGDEQHLYRFDEVEMLAHKICELFEIREFANYQLRRGEVLQRHNPGSIVNELSSIYSLINSN